MDWKSNTEVAGREGGKEEKGERETGGEGERKEKPCM